MASGVAIRKVPVPTGNSRFQDELSRLGSGHFLDGLGSDVTESLLPDAERFCFARYDVIDCPRAGHDFGMMLDGYGKLCSPTIDGKEAITDVIGPGECFGAVFDALLLPDATESGACEKCQVVGLQDGVALRIRNKSLIRLLRKDHCAMLGAAREFARRERCLQRRISVLHYRCAQGKIAGLLMELARRFGRMHRTYVVIEPRLSQQDIAGLAGLRRETVSEVLAEFRQRGLIDRSRRTVLIHDLKGLGKIR